MIFHEWYISFQEYYIQHNFKQNPCWIQRKNRESMSPVTLKGKISWRMEMFSTSWWIMFLIVWPQQSILLKWLFSAGSGRTHNYFSELQQESTFPDEKSDSLSLGVAGNLLVFQKPLALAVSTQINCYLFDPDAFFLLSIRKKAKQKLWIQQHHLGQENSSSYRVLDGMALKRQVHLPLSFSFLPLSERWLLVNLTSSLSPRFACEGGSLSQVLH